VLFDSLKNDAGGKLLFSQSVKIMNGAADRVTPDLFNTLTGFETIDNGTEEAEAKLDKAMV
jgi:hypothetical protein